jgi:hypothetical protein
MSHHLYNTDYSVAIMSMIQAGATDAEIASHLYDLVGADAMNAAIIHMQMTPVGRVRGRGPGIIKAIHASYPPPPSEQPPEPSIFLAISEDAPLDVLKAVIQTNPGALMQTNNKGKTPLEWATQLQRDETILEALRCHSLIKRLEDSLDRYIKEATEVRSVLSAVKTEMSALRSLVAMRDSEIATLKAQLEEAIDLLAS